NQGIGQVFQQSFAVAVLPAQRIHFVSVSHFKNKVGNTPVQFPIPFCGLKSAERYRKAPGRL
ncbi:MAG TPA: hypothetical protein PKB07_10580, partial [Flavilitoribacter sp.]|nr:hypothetical protein [Flavilitoribacter sp.]